MAEGTHQALFEQTCRLVHVALARTKKAQEAGIVVMVARTLEVLHADLHLGQSLQQ